MSWVFLVFILCAVVPSIFGTIRCVIFQIYIIICRSRRLWRRRFHGFQSWQQYSSRGMTRDFKSVSMRERFRDWNTLNTHPILPLAFLTIFIIWRVKMDVLLVIIPRSLTCSLNHHMFCRLLQILFPILFHIAEVRTCWHWISYYLYLPICTAYVNHFVASVCPLHLLFLEGLPISIPMRIPITLVGIKKYSINKYNIVAFWLKWKHCNEIQLTKSKTDFYNRKIKNHPPSPADHREN